MDSYSHNYGRYHPDEIGQDKNEHYSKRAYKPGIVKHFDEITKTDELGNIRPVLPEKTAIDTYYYRIITKNKD